MKTHLFYLVKYRFKVPRQSSFSNGVYCTAYLFCICRKPLSEVLLRVSETLEFLIYSTYLPDTTSKIRIQS
jgi:hypothetical protein